MAKEKLDTESSSTDPMIWRVENDAQRLDKFLHEQLPHFSRTRIDGFILDGLVTLNTKACKKSERLKPGDRVTLTPPPKLDDGPTKKPALLLDQMVRLYEDEWYIAVYKPPGLAVHPGSGAREYTVADYFIEHHAVQASLFADADRPGIVHRLDKDTSGILMLAKTPEAATALQDEFREREVIKYYTAWVDGVIKTPFRRISSPIIRHPKHRTRYTTASSIETPGAREALTQFRLLAVRNGKSFIRIRLYTGRTHQIRVHMSSIGHPVCGDKLYGSRFHNLPSDPPGIMLHAHSLRFGHPFLGHDVSIFSILPPRMRNYWQSAQ